MNEINEALACLLEAYKISDSKDKVSILSKQKDNPVLQDLVRMAYERQYSDLSVYDELEFSSVITEDEEALETNLSFFKSLATKLHNSSMEKEEEEIMVDAFLDGCSPGEAFAYTRILSNYLGFGVRIINRVWNPKTFWRESTSFVEPQKASTYIDCWARGPRLAEPKLDGVRINMGYRYGQATGYSRSGKVQTNIEFALREVEEILLKQGLENEWVVVDTEAVVDGNWGLTTGLLRRKSISGYEQELERLRFHVFDAFIVKEGLPKYRIGQQQRTEAVQEIFENSKYFVPIPSKLVTGEKEAQEFYQQMLDQGYEGLILKDPEGLYEPGKRSRNWMKMKPVTTVDGRITGFEEGSNRLEGMLGAFDVVLEDGRKTQVGTGLTDAQRLRFWKERESLLGQWLELAYQPDKHEVSACRFPRFIRIRKDRDW